jgi:hypothetical protein
LTADNQPINPERDPHSSLSLAIRSWDEGSLMTASGGTSFASVVRFIGVLFVVGFVFVLLVVVFLVATDSSLSI